MSPSPGLIVAGVLAAVLAALAASIAAVLARHTGNWLYWLCTAGSSLFLLGLAGQRAFPNEDDVHRLGAAVAAARTPGPWDAGVSIPVIHIALDPVALAGLLLAAAGLSLSLLFEGTAAAGSRPGVILPPLDEDDAV
ncbi:MAG: hypothetical protein ABR541_07810 [Candidatus Dormibacteria bacterium]